MNTEKFLIKLDDCHGLEIRPANRGLEDDYEVRFFEICGERTIVFAPEYYSASGILDDYDIDITKEVAV